MKFVTLLIISLIVLTWPFPCRAGDAIMTDDTVYLTERISVTTETGIFSVAKGTELLTVSTLQNRLKVKTKDGTVLSLKLSQVTKDPDFAAKLAQQEAVRISALQAQAAAAAQESAEKQRQAELQRQQVLDYVAAATVKPTPVTFSKMPGSALDNPPPATFKLNPRKKKK